MAASADVQMFLSAITELATPNAAPMDTSNDVSKVASPEPGFALEGPGPSDRPEMVDKAVRGAITGVTGTTQRKRRMAATAVRFDSRASFFSLRARRPLPLLFTFCVVVPCHCLHRCHVPS